MFYSSYRLDGSMANDEFHIFDQYFQYQIKYMHAGIEATMKNDTVHLCILGLSVYTEVLGGLVTGNLKEPSNERKNYEAFLPYLGSAYVELNEKMKQHRLSLYGILRSKLGHEFSPKPSFAYWLNPNPKDKPGIEYAFGDSLPLDFPRKNGVNYPAPNHLTVNVKEYYRDFKEGVNKYHEDLKSEMKKNVFERPLFNNFMKATVIGIGL